jgi:hypothetical protein
MALAAEKRETVPVNGPRFSGELIAADAKWNFTFRLGEDQRALPAADIVAWGAPAEPKGRTKLDGYFPPAELLLADGGLLVADLKESKGASLTISSDTLSGAEVPRRAVRAILFGPPLDRGRRDELASRALDPTKSDRLILHNGDVVAGRVQAFLQTAAADGKRQFLVELMVGDVLVKVAADRIAAVGFAAREDEPKEEPAKHAVLGFRDGSRLVAHQLEISGDQAAVKDAAGQTWKAPRGDVVFLQPLAGKMTYVSDLVAATASDDSGGAKGTPVGRGSREKAAIYRYVPLLSANWPYYADRNVRGAHLRSGGRLWLKGIGMHSGGALTAALPGEFSRFEAELALDDSVGQRGSVIFEVKVYGRNEGRISVLRTFTSQTIRGGTPPISASVDLTDAVGISLAVLFAERGDELDHANWLNARLVP